jgi:pimeloyl-ACP methyl ester carboxylesterase
VELDLALLNEHASHTRDGVTERAFTFDVGGDRCFGLLSLPERPVKDLGFVVCHSYALELLTLRRTERGLARTLAGLGHPVLAFHRRGCGDSTGSLADQDLDAHLEDTRRAAEVLSAETGTSRLGLIGAKFGALIAALAAGDAGSRVERLILMNAPLTGAAYFRKMIKEMHLVQLSIRDEKPRRTTEEMLEDLATSGMVDVLGFPVYRTLYGSLGDHDLSKDLAGFTGDALLLQVSKRSGIGKDIQALADRLQAGGATVRVEALREPAGTTFGGVAYVSTGDPMTREDVQADLVAGISKAAADWMAA